MSKRIKGSEPIRVLHMAPIRMGGITELVLTLSEKIDSEKIQFDYLTFEDTFEQASKRAIEAHSTIYRVDLKSIKNPFFRGIKKFIGVSKLIHDEKIKIIHINSSTPYEVLVAIAAKIGGAKKIIYHSHNSSYYPGQKLTMLSPLFKALMPFVITDYLACSDAAAEFMFPKKIASHKGYTVIKNGIDYEKNKYNPEIRKTYRTKLNLENNYVIGHVGRFNIQKNHSFLIDIFNEIYSRDKSARLLLVGVGETQEAMKQKVHNLGLEKVVLFYGLSNEVNNLLNVMDIFVMPSLYEGLPVAGVEAQASGLPLVVSDTITKELNITNNITFLSLNDGPDIWARKVLELKGVERVDSKEMVKKAGFSIDDTAEVLKNIYLA